MSAPVILKAQSVKYRTDNARSLYWSEGLGPVWSTNGGRSFRYVDNGVERERLTLPRDAVEYESFGDTGCCCGEC